MISLKQALVNHSRSRFLLSMNDVANACSDGIIKSGGPVEDDKQKFVWCQNEDFSFVVNYRTNKIEYAAYKANNEVSYHDLVSMFLTLLDKYTSVMKIDFKIGAFPYRVTLRDDTEMDITGKMQLYGREVYVGTHESGATLAFDQYGECVNEDCDYHIISIG